jgi:excisionase family DNA binding protein
MSTPWSSDDLPPVLSTEEVAELLRLNPRTVLAMARDGRLPGHRLPGCRKVQYLTDEILATLADAPGIEEMTARKSCGPTPERAVPTEVDPCDIWGAAPSWQPNEDWRGRCRSHWVELANKAGLPGIKEAESHDPKDVSGDKRSAGHVDVDGLLYEVLVGPRQRSRYVDDEGEVRWGLIDAVWVQPVIAANRGAWSRAACQTT